jgi:hypothetical protein
MLKSVTTPNGVIRPIRWPKVSVDVRSEHGISESFVLFFTMVAECNLRGLCSDRYKELVLGKIFRS